MNVAALTRIAGYRTGVISFDFPSMPDVIELARSADYYTNYSPIMPDGMHQYRGTKPMEIPLTFKLHAMDRTFCPYGSVTLLQLAARLHSFVLPISPDGSTNVQIKPLIARDFIDQDKSSPNRETQLKELGVKSEADQLYDTTLNTPVHKLLLQGDRVGVPFPPVTCLLNLIWVAEDQPGIACIGYVREVRVRLMGPWLRGPTGEYNLPSCGEFEFTFVHRPSHNNNLGLDVSKQNGQFNSTPATTDSQAFATDVRNQLYNTRNLVLMADYHGFNNAPAISSNPLIR